MHLPRGVCVCVCVCGWVPLHSHDTPKLYPGTLQATGPGVGTMGMLTVELRFQCSFRESAPKTVFPSFLL